MGNSDSQPAVPSAAGTGFSLPRRPKPCSLRFRPTKRKVLPPQSWWKGREVGQGSRLRTSFVHNQYSCFGELTTDRCDRYHASSGTASPWDLGGDATGVLYAERDAGLDRPVGPVHLLRLAGASDHAEANAPPLRTSKGSSLSSEGSWYDSPWGPIGELSDADRSCSSGHIEDTRDSASSSGPMEESSGGGRTMIDASPPAPSGDPLASQVDLRGFHSLTPTTFANLYSNPRVTSCSLVSGGGAEKSCPEPGDFSSHTLPCRKAVPDTDSSSRKSMLKGRMRRLGDWTGSLSRKRRRLQSNDPESLDSGVDVQMDSSTSLPWYLGPYQATPSSTYASTLPTRHRRDEDDDRRTFRQNVYETFMRELETVHGADELEPSEETEETSSGSGGSLEQLDLLLEKERGLVRRAGWLSFKPLITLHKDRRLELMPRRRWRRYWVTLKGCTLLFYESFGKSLEGQDAAVHYALFAEGSIVQAVPEHPKKENVFCLSNAYGDVYLFQAESQTELENWVAAVHSACASLLARQHGKADALRLLRSQTHGLLQKVDMDGKMKKMAELQLSVVSDQKNRKAIESQIEQWERNLERFHMDLFRVRCYLASLQGGEPPNPKMLLAAASRSSKATLSRLGIFSVSSFHALVCSRDEATLKKRSRSQSHGIRGRRGLLSSLKGLDTLTRRGRNKKQPISQVLEKNSEGQLGCLLACNFEEQKLDDLANHYSIAPPEGNLWDNGLKTPVYFLDNQVINVTIKHDHTVADVLSLACKVRQLDPGQHCLRVSMGMGPETEFITPAPGDLAQGMQCGKLLIFPLNLHTMRLSRPDSSVDYGFAVTGHVDGSRTSHIFVSDINPDGLAFTEGLRPGDEILVLNGSDVSTLDLGLMHTHFGQLKVSLVLRREDVALEDQSPIWPDARPTDFILPVPTPCPLGVCADMQDEQLSAQLSADAAAGSDVTCRSVGPCHDEKPDLANGHGQHLQGMGTVSTLMPEAQETLGCLIELQRDPQAGLPQPPCPRNRPSTEKLRKVMQELVDTEKSYVKDLSCLFEIYLKPLQSQTFLSLAEMESLFGSLPEMLEFQKVFLQTLEDRISSSPDFSTLETPDQVKKLLLSLGGSFLYYADHFKLYSGFCANHTKVQKVLERAKTDWAFKEFLEAKNPTKQHSSTLESYLIKPVQRVLRYPLLLRELVSLTEAGSQEHLHLSEALKAMEKVASHINEMQKIYEDYGVVFDQLVAEQSSTEEVTEISMGEFLMHSSVTWLNPLPSLGRMRKDPELTVFVFRRAVILVCRDRSRVKRRAAAARSATSQGDPDPFRFRWLVPLSALQVRLGNTAGSEPNCIWELIHTKSELEGRPETPFQLCSSSLEAKATIVRAIRSLLREGTRRTGPPWRGSRERLASTPNGAGASLTTWLLKGPQAPTDALDSSQLKSDEGTQSCGTRSSASDLGDLLQEQSGSWHAQEQSLAPQQPLSDVPSRKDAERQGPQHDFLTSTIEAQLRRLWLVEEKAFSWPAPCVQQEQVELDTHTIMGSSAPAADNLCESRGEPLDGTASADLSVLLERDFSVHSLTSVVSEDCFYDKSERWAPCARPSSAGASSCSPD
ncbi:rho guanine nucleotide exchange factor TIAM2-like isoform X2 [Brienomyrus brachyistius]|uniref:rho guanine nucleotide exchange factor TIAM2-like isoform X2 n=1 Tax=Brienomyrus brachyistius TaxID=42636 RepID=UPI0020B4186F|nr:rho guanine nucleotide exchange factor TIAM2-like isoform X2 [Brienomyrus brachyistius]